VLEREGFRVTLAANGKEMEAGLRSGLPSIILMDLHLPEVDGLTLTRRLKADPETAAIPVVAVTADAMRGDREKALAAGCAGYIPKPVDTRRLGDQVRAYLDS
jgi:two-component system, cell cycle response regulator DivK